MLRYAPSLSADEPRSKSLTLTARIGHSGEHILLLASFGILIASAPCLSAQSDNPSASGQQGSPQAQICDEDTHSDSHPLSLKVAKSQEESSATERQSTSLGLSESRGKEVGLPEVQRSSSAQQEQVLICKKTDNPGELGQSPAPSPQTDQAVEPQAVSDAPIVTYTDGKLTIDAQNVPLRDVIEAIRVRSGIVVEFPSEAMDDRVFDRVGPTPFRDALSQLLYGSRFNYIIQTSSQDPQLVTKLTLSAQHRAGSAEPPKLASQPVVDQADNQALSGEVEPPPQPVQPSQPALTPSVMQGIPVGFNVQQAATAAGKTPGQILDELQKRQQQVLDDQAPPQ